MDTSAYIVHADMDAFFAAIEQRDNPRLKNKPVIVGADPKKGKGRGVVSTCSYEARKYGIHSAMPISQAFRKCPRGIFLPVNMDKYSRVSEQVYEVLYTFTPDIEPVSIDEAFLDIRGSYHLFNGLVNTCKEIKTKIRSQLGLTVSIGLAPTKMAAKIASDMDKPDGLIIINRHNLGEFLQPLDIGKMPGVGPVTQKTLNNLGVNTIGDIAKFDKWQLIEAFGSAGENLWLLSQGLDESRIEPDSLEKSIGNEITFEEDTNNTDLIKSSLMYLCEKVSFRLRQSNYKGKTILLKIRFEDFSTHTRQATLYNATNFVEVLYNNINKLYSQFSAGKKVRLVGVKVSRLAPADLNESLFTSSDEETLERLHAGTDRIKNKFGAGAIRRASAYPER